MAPLQSAFGDDAVVLQESDYQILMLATIFPILGTGLVSPILDSVIEPFGTSAADVGLMMSFLTAPAIVGIPVSGILADRYGRRPVLVGGLLLFGGGGTAIALTTDFRVVLALRVVQGIGFSGIVPTITTSIGDMYDGPREVTAQGLRMMVNGISGTGFPLVSGALVVLAWQYPFLLYAVAFPVAAAVYLIFDEPTDDTPDESDESDETAVVSYRAALLSYLRHPRVLALLVVRGSPVIVWIGFLTYNSLVVVRVMGGTPLQAGALVATGNLVFAAGASQIGRIVSLLRGKFYTAVAANLALGVGFVGFLFAPRAILAAPWIALAGGGFSIALSLSRSYVTELAPETLRGGLVSLSAASARVTSTVTPIAMGFAIDATSPVLGETGALQLAGVAVAVAGSASGILLLLVASVSGPVPDDLAELVTN